VKIDLRGLKIAFVTSFHRFQTKKTLVLKIDLETSKLTLKW